jgi:hypothetical protein
VFPFVKKKDGFLLKNWPFPATRQPGTEGHRGGRFDPHPGTPAGRNAVSLHFRFEQNHPFGIKKDFSMSRRSAPGLRAMAGEA